MPALYHGKAVTIAEVACMVTPQYVLPLHLPQMQMFQVWIQLFEGAGRVQIPPLAEGGPGRMHVWSNSIWNLLEPIFWHSCKWFTKVSEEKSVSINFRFLQYITLMYEWITCNTWL